MMCMMNMNNKYNNKNNMIQISKWGFGMAPLKKPTDEKNRQSISAVLSFVDKNEINNSNNLIEQISWVKGLFNRIIRQDQWDWFTINSYFDFPKEKDVINIVSALSTLRNAIMNHNDSLGEKALQTLQNSNFSLYCANYLTYTISKDTSIEYLYILSRREEPNILKIGMTTRNIQKRVKEINSATGVIYPFSARKVYKVRDSAKVEKDIHNLLNDYRIRQDREFFMIDFKEACSIIETYLLSHEQYYYE